MAKDDGREAVETWSMVMSGLIAIWYAVVSVRLVSDMLQNVEDVQN